MPFIEKDNYEEILYNPIHKDGNIKYLMNILQFFGVSKKTCDIVQVIIKYVYTFHTFFVGVLGIILCIYIMLKLVIMLISGDILSFLKMFCIFILLGIDYTYKRNVEIF